MPVEAIAVEDSMLYHIDSEGLSTDRWGFRVIGSGCVHG